MIRLWHYDTLMHKCCYAYCIITQDSCWYPSAPTRTHYTLSSSHYCKIHTDTFQKRSNDWQQYLFIYDASECSCMNINDASLCCLFLSFLSSRQLKCLIWYFCLVGNITFDGWKCFEQHEGMKRHWAYWVCVCLAKCACHLSSECLISFFTHRVQLFTGMTKILWKFKMMMMIGFSLNLCRVCHNQTMKACFLHGMKKR